MAASASAQAVLARSAAASSSQRSSESTSLQRKGTAFLERTLSKHLSSGQSLGAREPSPRLVPPPQEFAAVLEAASAKQFERQCEVLRGLEERLSAQLEGFKMAHVAPLAAEVASLSGKLDRLSTSLTDRSQDVQHELGQGRSAPRDSSPKPCARPAYFCLSSTCNGKLPPPAQPSNSDEPAATVTSARSLSSDVSGGARSQKDLISPKEGSSGLMTNSPLPQRKASFSSGIAAVMANCAAGCSNSNSPAFRRPTSPVTDSDHGSGHGTLEDPRQRELRNLIENDKEVRSLLKDARKSLSSYAERADREISRKLGAAVAMSTKADLSESGTLYVHLVSAVNLKAGDANGYSDPYVKLSLRGHHRKSRVIKKTLDPEWDETFTFRGQLGELIEQPLKLNAMDWDVTSFDDPLGSAELDVSGDYYLGVERTFSVDLDTQGSVYLEIWFHLDDDSDSTHSGSLVAREDSEVRAHDTPLSRFGVNCKRICKRWCRARAWCNYLVGPVVHPDSRFRSMWNVMLAFFICYCGIGVPLEIAFEADMVAAMCGTGEQLKLRAECTDFQVWFWGNFMVDLWFIADILVNFRTGYVHEGHFVSDDWLAAKNYLRGSFFMDCLGTFPLNMLLMLLNPDNPYGDIIEEVSTATDADTGGGADVGRVNRMLRLLRMAKLLKLARMAKLAKYMEHFESFLNPGVLLVFKLVLMSIFACHWIGCLWWLVSDLELSMESLESPWYAGENTWHPPHWLKHDSNLFTKYMHAFFWGAGMVTSLVPRDIEPVTVLESIVTTITMFFGLLLNAFVISSLTQALAQMDSKREIVGKQLNMMKTYLVLKSIPSDLRHRILEYHDYLFTSSAAFADMNMFARMPAALTTQLDLSTNRKLIGHTPFFRDVSDATLVSLLSSFYPLVSVPGQLIAVGGTPLEATFCIHRGHVQLETKSIKGFHAREAKRLLTNNNNFGFEDFVVSRVTDAPPLNSASAQAVTYCDLVSLPIETLSQAVSNDATFASAIAQLRKHHDDEERRRKGKRDGDSQSERSFRTRGSRVAGVAMKMIRRRASSTPSSAPQSVLRKSLTSPEITVEQAIEQASDARADDARVGGAAWAKLRASSLGNIEVGAEAGRSANSADADESESFLCRC